MQAMASGDAARFYEHEIAERSALPAAVRPARQRHRLGRSRKEAEEHARALGRAAPDEPDMEVLGPAEAPLAVLRGRHRFRLLVQAPRRAHVQGFLRAMIARAERPRGSVQVQIDVDPQSFL